MTRELKVKDDLPPGDFGIWLVIYIELFTFAALFIAYAFARRAELELFNQSQLLLDQHSGFINTLILITSSYFVVKAIESIQNIQDHKWPLNSLQIGFLELLV